MTQASHLARASRCRIWCGRACVCCACLHDVSIQYRSPMGAFVCMGRMGLGCVHDVPDGWLANPLGWVLLPSVLQSAPLRHTSRCCVVAVIICALMLSCKLMQAAAASVLLQLFCWETGKVPHVVPAQRLQRVNLVLPLLSRVAVARSCYRQQGLVQLQRHTEGTLPPCVFWQCFGVVLDHCSVQVGPAFVLRSLSCLSTQHSQCCTAV